jgi:hypothetical protein
MPVPFAIFILVAAHFFDWASFLVMVGRHGLGAEGNPLVVHVATEWGLPGLTITKIAAVALSAAVFAVLLPKNRKLAMVVLAFGVLAGAFGTLSNVISM